MGQTVIDCVLGQGNEEAGLIAVFGKEFIAVRMMDGLAICKPGFDCGCLVLRWNGGQANIVRKSDGKGSDVRKVGVGGEQPGSALNAGSGFEYLGAENGGRGRVRVGREPVNELRRRNCQA